MSTLVAPVSQAASALRLPGDPRDVRRARGFVRETLTEWGLAELVDDASLVVTELATNAVVHAHSAYTVSASRQDGSFRLEVRDGGSGVPCAGDGSEQRLGGRGLLLVAALSSRWGVRVDDAGGKTVWAELAA